MSNVIYTRYIVKDLDSDAFYHYCLYTRICHPNVQRHPSLEDVPSAILDL